MTISTGERLLRFDRVERAVHWTNATLFLVLIVTGYTMEGAPFTGWIGNRASVRDLHLYAGLVLPVPLVLGLLVPAGRQLRVDARRIARWTADDRRWWSRRARRNGEVRLGKFNSGQKANAIFVAATLFSLLVTGLVMHYGQRLELADDWRTGATFVHRWWALAVVVTVVGHILFALADREALRAMVGGTVSAGWARRHAPRWHAEMASDTPDTPGDRHDPGDARTGSEEPADVS